MSIFSPIAILFDVAGDALRVVTDGGEKVLGAVAKTAQKEDDSLHYTSMNEGGALQATLYDRFGNPIALPVGVTDAGLWVTGFVKDGGGSSDLIVNGSTTPVEFTFDADPDKDIAINAVIMVLVSNALTFGSDKFGAINALTNGVDISVTSDGSTGSLGQLKQNEGFLHSATPGGFNLIISTKDVISSIISLGGGVLLHAGTSDKVIVTIQDNILTPTAAGNYFKISVQGVKEA